MFHPIHHHRVFRAASMLCAALFLLTPPAFAETPKSDSSLQSSLQEVKDSVDALAQIKDSATTAEKTQKEFQARQLAIQKIIGLGRRELADLAKRLKNLNIAELVAYDYAFDAADAAQTLSQLVQSGLAYYDEVQKRLAAAAESAGVRRIAAEIKLWRSQFYTPVFRRIIAVQLVLRSRGAIATANSRFDNITADLRELKNSGLVRFDELEPILTPASGDIQKAQALNAEAAMLLLKTLKEPLTQTADAASSDGALSDYNRITNLANQSLNEIRDAYKKFLELNDAVKKMLNAE